MSTTTLAPSALFKKSLGWVIALSVVMIIAGILAIIMPPIAGIAVTVLFGWLLTFSGVAHLAYAWHTRGTGAILWELLLGAAYLFAGIYTLLHPLLSLVSLTLVLGVYLFVEAILEFIMAVRFVPAGRLWVAIRGRHCDFGFGHHDLAKLAIKFRMGPRSACGIQHAIQRNEPPDDCSCGAPSSKSNRVML